MVIRQTQNSKLGIVFHDEYKGIRCFMLNKISSCRYEAHTSEVKRRKFWWQLKKFFLQQILQKHRLRDLDL